MTVQGDQPAKQYKVSGVASLDGKDNLAGAKLVVMTLPEAQRVTGHDGYDSISVAASDPDATKAALQQALGTSILVRTGKEAAEQQAQDLSDALGFIRTALLVFAGVALLVGGFLIFNTFTVTVAQRTKEFALLRVLGASRRQILNSVLIETIVVGLLASILGVLVGIVLAPALAAMLKAFGLDLGTTGLVVKGSTVVIGIVIGLVATVISGLRARPPRHARGAGGGDARQRHARHRQPAPAPHHRLAGADRARPAGAVRRAVRRRVAAARRASLLGLGAVLMMFGVAFLAPLLVRPLARGLGAPLARFQGLTGVLARENAIRQPQRTAVTAAALMVGLALVVLVAIFAAGLKASVTKTIDDQVSAALIVQNQDGFTPIPKAVADTVKQVPGVTAVSPVSFSTGILKGRAATRRSRASNRDDRQDALAQVEAGLAGDAVGPDRTTRRCSTRTSRSPTTSRSAARRRSRRRPASSRPTRSPACSRTRPG